MSNEPMLLKQMRNEAIDMLVLWAASKEYSAVSGRAAWLFQHTRLGTQCFEPGKVA
jgi:hypothetical protein